MRARVTAVNSAAAAFRALSEEPPDVLLSDIGMPDEDGYSLIRRIGALPASEGGKVPAAALTAYARVEDRMRVLRSGFQIHLPKPLEPPSWSRWSRIWLATSKWDLQICGRVQPPPEMEFFQAFLAHPL